MNPSRNGYIFHGGCQGCNQPLRICPTCCYMEPNWDLPSRNPQDIEREAIKAEMIQKARHAMSLAKNKH